jgi:leucine-zipper-like transcriptional regulator 1
MSTASRSPGGVFVRSPGGVFACSKPQGIFTIGSSSRTTPSAAFSSNGTRWSNIRTNMTWIGGNASVVYGSRMITTGGGLYGSTTVMSSTNGVTWSVLSVAPWERRTRHVALVYDGRLWVIGGIARDPDFPVYYHRSDVWYSTDGVSWTQSTDNIHETSPQLLFYGMGGLVYGGAMWIIGTGTLTNVAGGGRCVYTSTNGATWSQVTDDAAFGDVSAPSVVFNDAMWIMTTNGVYCSTDGATWTLATSTPGYGSINLTSHKAVVYHGRIWLVGSGAVWSSADGVTWTLENDSPSFGNLSGHSILVFPEV